MLKSKTILSAVLTLALASVITSTPAQEVAIPDPGLDAAIREALGKPNGPLTEPDLLNLTQLDAHGRNITNLAGLEFAHNLTTLLLHLNQLTSFALPGAFTNLVILDLSANPLTNVSIPGGMTNLFELVIVGNPLAHLSLPADLTL